MSDSEKAENADGLHESENSDTLISVSGSVAEHDRDTRYLREAAGDDIEPRERRSSPPVPATRPLLIGLGGKLRSGKDTVADHLVDRYGFIKMNFSDALNEFLMIQNPVVPVYDKPSGQNRQFYELIELQVERAEQHPTNVLHARYADIVTALGYVEAKKIPEVRRLLQATATDAARKVLGPDVWVNALLPRIKLALAEGTPVVTTRFNHRNEMDAIKALGGVVIFVDRPDFTGVPVEPDPSIPEEEIHIQNTGETVSRILLGDARDKTLCAYCSSIGYHSIGCPTTRGGWGDPDARPLEDIIDNVEAMVGPERAARMFPNAYPREVTGKTLVNAIDTALANHSSETELTAEDYEGVLENHGDLIYLNVLTDSLIASLVEQGRGTYHNMNSPQQTGHFPPQDADGSPASEAYDG